MGELAVVNCDLVIPLCDIVQHRLSIRNMVTGFAALAKDSSDHHSKIDKAQRSRIFCDWLVDSLGHEYFASGTSVVDVAGGKGDIPIQLWIQRGIPTTLIDPRPIKLGKYNRKLVAKAEATDGRKMSLQLLCCFDAETLKLHKELFTDCSILVGMHPDEATEAIVDAAITLRKPFVVCALLRNEPGISRSLLP